MPSECVARFTRLAVLGATLLVVALGLEWDRRSDAPPDKALDAASEESWTVVDMKKDWKVVYLFQN